jgi:hypothetical protein
MYGRAFGNPKRAQVNSARRTAAPGPRVPDDGSWFASWVNMLAAGETTWQLRLCWLLLALPLSLSLSVETRAEGQATESLARVLMEFVHTCAPAQCETLRLIVGDDESSMSEQALAAALLRVRHVPDPKDMTRLQAIASDPEQTASVRAIARVIHRLVHIPSNEDRVALAAVASGDECRER